MLYLLGHAMLCPSHPLDILKRSFRTDGRFFIIAVLSEFRIPHSDFRIIPHGPHALRSQPDRLSAHRRRSHGAVQLAVRPAARRAVPAADRRYRRRAKRRGGAGPDPARLSLAGHRLGRRARSRRPVRAVLPIAATGRAIRRRSKNCWPADSPIATTPRPRKCRPSAKRPQAEKRPFLYSRRWMAETPAEQATFEAEGRKAVVRLKMPREGKLVIDDLVRGESSSNGPASRTTSSSGPTARACITWPAWSTTSISRSRTSSGPKSICRTRRGRFSSPSRSAIRCRSTPTCRYVAEPGSKNKLSKRKLDKYLKNRDFAQVNEHGLAIAQALGLTTTAETFNPVIVDFYEQVGYLPDAIINYLVLLGWSLDDKTEFLTREQMIENFSLERVTKAPASFDPKKLWAFQDHYMQQLPLKQKVATMLAVPAEGRAGARRRRRARSGPS